MKKTILLIITLLTATFTWGQKYSNEFLAIGAGARAQGMGNAATVSTKDAYATYWNPAGIADVSSDLQLSFMHSEWFAGVGKYDFLSLVYPISTDKDLKRTIGLSVVRFGVDDIPNTLSLYESDGTVNYNNVVPFSASDYAITFSYAQSTWVSEDADLYFGGNAKIVYRQIGPFAKAYGFGFDLGLQYHLPKWSVGLAIKDATNTFNAWQFSFTEKQKEILSFTNNEIPIKTLEVTRPWAVLGGAYHTRWSKIGFLTELNFIVTLDGQRNTLVSSRSINADAAWGLELDYNETVFLRAGLNQFQRKTDLNGKKQMSTAPTLGVGLNFKVFNIDYAFTDISNTSEKTYSHVISLLLKLNFSSSKRKTN